MNLGLDLPNLQFGRGCFDLLSTLIKRTFDQPNKVGVESLAVYKYNVEAQCTQRTGLVMG